jgi:hypothetical protein
MVVMSLMSWKVFRILRPMSNDVDSSDLDECDVLIECVNSKICVPVVVFGAIFKSAGNL